MGADKYEKEKHDKPVPYVLLLKPTLATPAWRTMSHGARSLYAALKSRYNHKRKNNGRLFLSQRTAANEIGSHHNEIARWFRELQHYGFIRQTVAGYLGVEGKGKAPHWRLTEVGYMNDQPTREFEKWDGTKFRDGKTESRAPIPARGVPEKAHTGVPENQPLDPKSVPEKAHIQTGEGVPEKAHILIKPFVSPSSASSASAPHRLTVTPQLVATIEKQNRTRAQRATKSVQASVRVRGGGR
jgi:DNA-binding transcriptional MocR family regulator